MVLNLPYVVIGTITDTDATNPTGARVVMRNDRTGEKINTTTNSNGQYLLDAANLESGYADSDRLTILCSFGDAENESSFLISDYGGGHTINLTLATQAESSDTTYCQIQDVLDELGDKSTSDISYERVRKIILRSEAMIDERTNTKFSSTTATNEEHDLDQYTSWKSPEQLRGYSTDLLVGNRNDFMNTSFNDRIKLNKTPIISVTTLQKNTGERAGTDSWTTLTEQTGSGGDFIVDDDTGIVTFIDNIPALGTRRVRVTYNYGYATVPKVVEDLCILLSVKKVLLSKTHGSQFDSTDSIALEGISISKGISGSVSYMTSLNEQINLLWNQVGDFVQLTA